MDVLCVLADTHRRPVPRTNVLICVLMDSHRRPVSADDGDTRTHTDTHGHTDRHRCPVSRGPKSPEQATGRVSVLSPRTNMLICVLMDSHRRHVCADRHTRTHKDSHGLPVCADGHTRTPRGPKSPEQSTGRVSVLSPRTNVLICVLMDSHRRPVCADGDTRTAGPTDVLCVLADSRRRPVCTEQTAHSTGRTSVLSPRTNVLICVLMDSHRRPVCADGHTQTHTDSHGQPVWANRHTRTSCTAHVGQNHPNNPREGPAC
ncbi:unnamed protein product [Brassica rapa]|uniref:KaiA C-terminal domain-containing protein n=1 Tax=Brassica campestris TaxID=3711 RepID=A0A8D9GB87_BRACM|nr:unnamed protein product [Brassica rapa]